MREITSHVVTDADDHIKILIMDEPGAGGAHHHYRVEEHPKGNLETTDIYFQKGPVVEAGINGFTQEVLIAICIHRLECFQAGPFACDANAEALANLEQALYHLTERTKERMLRGAEGRYVL